MFKRKGPLKIVLKNASAVEHGLDQKGVVEKKPDESRSSPKGYLTNTRRSGFDREVGFYLEEIGPGQSALKGPSSREQITRRIEFLSRWASKFIKSEGENPEHFAKLAERQVLDCVCLGATLLVQLRRLADLLGTGARELAISHTSCNAAVLTALDIGTTLHQLTIVDFETGIDAWQKSKDGASRGGPEKRKRKIARNKAMAEEFKRRALTSRKSKTALMAEIGKKERLGPSQSFDAIRDGLKILSGDGGKPDA